MVKAFGVYDHAHDIALPAIMILGKDGAIAWKYVGASILDRPAEDALVAAVAKVSKG